jgi:hypothetical protein
LRIAGRRRDLPFFLALYDHLRHAPGVEEVTMNPATGSVLLRFDQRRRNTLFGALADSPMIALDDQSTFGLWNRRDGKETGRIDRFLAFGGGSAADPRTILLLVMLWLAVRQVIKGQLLAPAVTLVLYGLEHLLLFKRNRDAAESRSSAGTDSRGHGPSV